VKNPLFIVLGVCLLLMVGCASPTASPAPANEAPSSTPAATNIPDLEVSATTEPTPEMDPTPQADPTPQWANVQYVPDGTVRQALDVYLPESGEGPFPTILAIHGGGFRARTKNHFRSMAGPLSQLGYAVVAINYRLAPSDTYPAQVEDVFCALAWIHANHATYGFDSERVFALGDSAGGYLAAMLGTVDSPSDYLGGCPHSLPTSDPLRGVMVFYGFYDFTRLDGYPATDIERGLEPYWGAGHSEVSDEVLAEMSPLSWVDGSEPPFLLVHGILDESVPSWMSEDFAAALEEAGVEVELLLLEERHAFILQPVSSPANRQSLAAIAAFID
jgi:acetyl esterase/lipase